MKKLLNVAIIWQTLINLSLQQLKSPRNCGPIRHGIMEFQTDSKISYQDKTGIDVDLIDNGSDHSIVIDGTFRGLMLIAMDIKTKKSAGNFQLDITNLRRYRPIKCYLPRDTVRHISDRSKKIGSNKFTWYGKCSPTVRFYVYTMSKKSTSTNQPLWNKLELPCSQSTSFKAQLNEVVQLKIGSSITGANQRNNPRGYPYQRTWNKPAKPFSSRSPMFQWSEWMAWGGCTNSCGTGTKNRKRNCVTNDGRHVKYNQCRGESFEMVDCHTGNCPVWNEWGAWSTCTRTCGEGLTKRRRYCMYGNSCPGEKEEKKACNTNKCDRDQMKHICKDKYPFCNQWKAKGYCEDSFSTWMVANCRHTCGRCIKDNAVPECKDTYEQSCWRWKEDGECESETQQIRAFVRTKCKKSCGNCGFNDE